MIYLLAWLPFLFGVKNFIESFLKKNEKSKKVFQLYGTVRCAIGGIIGLFLTFLYSAYAFFETFYGSLTALMVFYLTIMVCNVVIDVKQKLNEN